MFCPNCGNDCGNAKFCPECGQKLQGKPEKEQKSSVWSVGMPCPHCGGTRLDGNHCAFCGAQLILAVTNDSAIEEDSFTLPKLNILFMGSIDLNENSLTYHKNGFFFKKARHFEVPYTQIESVTFICENELSSALVIVDETDPERIPKIDLLNKGEILYQLFAFLKTVAPSTTKFDIDERYLIDDVADKWLKQFDTDAFFNAYNPYHKRARKKIQELTGLSIQEADSIVAKVIRKRQEALYKETPSLAIRDLNRTIKEYQREEEEKERKRKELEALRDTLYQADD